MLNEAGAPLRRTIENIALEGAGAAVNAEDKAMLDHAIKMIRGFEEDMKDLKKEHSALTSRIRSIQMQLSRIHLALSMRFVNEPSKPEKPF
jgi:hypothetical protein